MRALRASAAGLLLAGVAAATLPSRAPAPTAPDVVQLSAALPASPRPPGRDEVAAERRAWERDHWNAAIGRNWRAAAAAIRAEERAAARRAALERAEQQQQASRSAPARSTVTGDDVWAALARCESGGNPSSVSANGLYHGAFQFLDSTWHSVGMSGSASHHPYEVQLAAAKRLQARSGWGQWPRCSRRLGLR